MEKEKQDFYNYVTTTFELSFNASGQLKMSRENDLKVSLNTQGIELWLFWVKSIFMNLQFKVWSRRKKSLVSMSYEGVAYNLAIRIKSH